jgi:uncharacterized protein (TIGR03000 family)
MRSFVRIGFGAMLMAGLVALAGGPSQAQAPKAPAATPVKSRIKVIVPQDDTELLIEEKATKATGKMREFETPGIESGKLYEYKFTAKWAPNNYTVITRNKTVKFKGGDDVNVDMTRDDPNDKAVIRYVPTPQDVVDQMIKLAGITKNDVVFEPGCGDARVVITAVKAGAKRGVGVDLDPERITEAKANVKKAGLEGNVESRQGDALDIKDLSDASVVFLYMADEYNALIRPILWRDLKVGSRVVSHRFTMGDWKPEKTITVKGEDGDEYVLHLWVITKEIKEKAAPAKSPDKDKK